MLDQLFIFDETFVHDLEIEQWLEDQAPQLRTIAAQWFQVLRDCGADVRELMHDGHPTACVDNAAFAYVNAFTAHVNIGFFRGAQLPDPEALLEGTGKLMRHVKLRPDQELDQQALVKLIQSAYLDMRQHLQQS